MYAFVALGTFVIFFGVFRCFYPKPAPLFDGFSDEETEKLHALHQKLLAMMPRRAVVTTGVPTKTYRTTGGRGDGPLELVESSSDSGSDTDTIKFPEGRDDEPLDLVESSDSGSDTDAIELPEGLRERKTNV